MDKRPDDPVRLIYVVAPIVVAIIGGVAGIAGVTQNEEIRDRYQLAADILVWLSVITLVVAMVAALYPIALERQMRALWRVVLASARGFQERRRFPKWAEKWSEYSSLVAAHLEQNQIQEWIDLQPRYRSLREWLMENSRFLPPDAPNHIRGHLAAQWDGSLTDGERALGQDGRGFFPMYRKLEFDMQMIDLLIQAKDHRHVRFTLEGIWDGLSSYSVGRGWGPLRTGDWRSAEEPAVDGTESDVPAE